MKRQHRVSVKLRNDIFDVESRVNKVREIRGWVNEQCGWTEDRFEGRIHSAGSIMDIWFEHEKDAVMCALRWA